MEIREIEDKKWWDENLIKFDEYTFLQSWDWGEINKINEKVWRWAIYEGQELVAMVQFFVISAKRGKMLFVPHGPVMGKNLKSKVKILKKVVENWNKIAIEEKCVCLRICPFWENSLENQNLLKSLGMRKAGVVMHAEDTWLVDLKGTEEEVMGRMRKTTRNLIRRGIKDGVKVRQSKNIQDVESLYELQMEVVRRNGFVPFSKKYLTRELEYFFASDNGVLFLGSDDQKITGAALIVFLGKYAFYYQSGSMTSKMPVNYVLQWEVIREAKRRGAEIYNMWGIAPTDDPKHPWWGLTTFKMGFGGECKKYMSSWDLPISFGYWPMKLIEMIPKTWRQKLAQRG